MEPCTAAVTDISNGIQNSFTGFFELGNMEFYRQKRQEKLPDLLDRRISTH